MRSIDDLFERLAQRGDGAYGLSAVSQLEHALQSADLAAAQSSSGPLILAALFHDVGHLVSDDDIDLAEKGIDDRHEVSGARILQRLFGPSVSDPVLLHVPAKRYLCAVEPTYFDRLSPDSVRSLKLQGGPMSVAEIADFESTSHHRAAIQLRRIDDDAKIPGKVTSKLDDFRNLAEELRR